MHTPLRIACAAAVLVAACSQQKSAPPPGAPVVQSFTASPLTVTAGQSSTLSWSVTGATSVSIDNGVGAPTANSVSVTPAATTTYTLTAVNGAGSATASVTVTVAAAGAPLIESFGAAPQSVGPGGSSTLTWKTTGATSVSIDHGVGAVAASGSASVTPAATTTYTLSATNATGTTSAPATVTVTTSSAYITPSAVSGDVVVAMDTHATTPISPYIYGLNFAEFGGPGLPGNWGDNWGSFLPRYSLNRFGGNRVTGHSFETGYSNCGSDCGSTFPNDDWGYSGVAQSPGLGNSLWPRIDKTFTNDAAFLLSVPIIGYVAKDAAGATTPPTAPDASTPATPDSSRWLQALPGNGHTATATPDLTDGFVYTNDLAKWVDTRYPAAKTDPVKNIQYELDNEPDIWGSTHKEIRGSFPGASTEMPTGFDELIDKSLAHARAIKSVTPSAVVWGGAFAGFDALTMLHYPDHQAPPAGYDYYFDYYLKRLHDADLAAGQRSVDVVDQHWYPQTDIQLENDGDAQTAAVVSAREQITRSLWDPKYAESSWVAQFGMPNTDAANCTVINAGVPTGTACAEFDTNCYCPIHLLTRMQSRIDRFYPGTKVAIGEWWYGRGGDISGGIVVADFLGVLGRYGAWGATMWPNACCGQTYTAGTYPDAQYTCALKAFDVYRNYDGAGAHFGDLEIPAALTDATFTNPAKQDERLTAYASLDSADPTRVVIVAINKSLTSALNTGLQITHTVRFATAQVWQVTGTNGGTTGTTGTTAAGTCTGPTRKADVALSLTNALNLTLPAQSITVVVLKP